MISGQSYSIVQEANGFAGIPPINQAAFAPPLPTQPATPKSLPTQLAPTQTRPRPSIPVAGLPTNTPYATEVIPTATRATPQPLPTISTAQSTGQPPVFYYAQSGDTLSIVAARFGISSDIITSPDPLSPDAMLNPGQLLIVPVQLGETTSDRQLLPDSEFIYSPSAVDFDIDAFVKQQGGFLSTYREYLGSTGWTTGADIIKRLALEESVNPRLLLALLELKAQWVTGQPSNLAEQYYPMGYIDVLHKELYPQLTWAIGKLQVGYYSWREGRITELNFPDGTSRRIAPSLNAGTVGLQYFFAQIENEVTWAGDLYSEDGMAAVYERLFGNPWSLARSVEPLFLPTLQQPVLNLPWFPGQAWSFSGGPHSPWNQEKEGGRSALDFAPPSTEPGCAKSEAWVTASATGLVTRAERGVVVIDQDGDGHEQTGWVMMYLHIATEGRRVSAGDWVEANDLIGHPSCEGGNATGTHVHIARKYNGEWISADGPLPFVLSGWTTHAGRNPYEGSLTKGDETITACTCGSSETRIARPSKDD